jgi:hypothetical protein
MAMRSKQGAMQHSACVATGLGAALYYYCGISFRVILFTISLNHTTSRSYSWTEQCFYGTFFIRTCI